MAEAGDPGVALDATVAMGHAERAAAALEAEMGLANGGADPVAWACSDECLAVTILR